MTVGVRLPFMSASAFEFEESGPGVGRPTKAAAFADRLVRLAAQAKLAGVDVVIISPGADLAYFAGHSVSSHERLTALVVPTEGTPQMLVPRL